MRIESMNCDSAYQSTIHNPQSTIRNQAMLSRVADSLYWMSRYLERAEHTARLLDLTLNQALDQSPDVARQRWQLVLASLRSPMLETLEAYPVTQFLTF